MLEGHTIVLGVTGSIAAYKSAELVRLLVKKGATVKVLMTPEARQFITSLTLATLSRHPVYTEIASEDEWHNHVMLGREADLLLIAPATAHTIAKMASGLCDNLLLATYLSACCPVMVVPAMDEDMWWHPATREQVDKLLSHGVDVLDVAHGDLASGLQGWGRMLEPQQIVEAIEARWVQPGHQLKGKKCWSQPVLPASQSIPYGTLAIIHPAKWVLRWQDYLPGWERKCILSPARLQYHLPGTPTYSLPVLKPQPNYNMHAKCFFRKWISRSWPLPWPIIAPNTPLLRK